MGAPAGNQYAVGNEGGRPTKLTPELLVLANGYLKWCEENPIIREKTKTTKNSEGREETVIETETMKRLPTVAGLASHLGVSRDTAYAWSEANKEFSDVMALVTTASERMKWEHGMAGTANATIARFGLSAMHGYREKSDVTSDGKALPTPILGQVDPKE